MTHKLLSVLNFWHWMILIVISLVLLGNHQGVEAASWPASILQGIAPTEVTISGPDQGIINETYTFTATVTPGTATTPITYVWTVSEGDGIPEVTTHIGGLTDELSHAWTAGGFWSVSVTASNADGSVTDHQLFRIEVPAFLDPPYPHSTTVTSVFDHYNPEYANDPNDFVLTWQGAERMDLSYDGHAGIDYDINYLPILASAESEQVVAAGWDDPQNHALGFGLYANLQHSNGYFTLYGHLSSLAVSTCTTSPCLIVRQGDVIGISGDTGSSDGPHYTF